MKLNIKKTALALLAVPMLALGVAGVMQAPTSAALTIAEGATAAHDSQTPSSLDGPGGVFSTIANVLLYIIAAISVIMLIIGGVRYTISQGDSSAVTSAKNTILYAVIGLIVAVLAYAIVNFVLTNVLPGGSTTP